MLVAISYAILIALMINLPNDMQNVGLAYTFINLPWLIILYVGRLHDAGYNGWWWLLVMFTSLLGMLALAAVSGDKEPNQYGEVPSGIFGTLFKKTLPSSTGI